MKRIFPQLGILFLLLLAFTGQAQPSSWQWGKRGGSMGSGTGSLADEQVIDMATDTKGNVYVLAVNNPGFAKVDGYTGVTVRDKLTLASWNCNGDFRWMKNIGGAGISVGKALGVDTLGGVYVTGYTISNNSLGYSYFDTDTSLGYTNKSMYIIKYDTAGTLQWLRMPQPDTVTASSVTFTQSLGMSVAPDGYIYLWTHLGPGNFNGAGYIVTDYGFHIWKYNKDGTFIDGTPIDITVSDIPGFGPDYTNLQSAHFIRDHHNGRFYLAGQFNPDYGTLTFGTTAISATGGVGSLPMYLTAFDHTGSNIWTRQSKPDKYGDIDYSPALDESGNIYIGGSVQPDNTFGGYAFSNRLGLYSMPFAISIDTNGNNIWTSNPSVNNTTYGNAIAVVNNTVALVGSYPNRIEWDDLVLDTDAGTTGGYFIYLARFNAVTGALLGLDTITGTKVGNYSSAITSDRNGNFYTGGKFKEQLYPAKDTLSKYGGTYDWFTAKFGAAYCDCTILMPAFTYTVATGGTFSFTYSGTTPYTSISWDFGDGSPASTAGSPAHTYTVPGSYIVCVTVANDCGSNIYCETVNTSGTGINRIPSFEHISIYPNPATRDIIIDNTTEGTALVIYNTLGNCILKSLLKSKQNRIDVSDLTSGVYMIRLIDRNEKQSAFMFIKE